MQKQEHRKGRKNLTLCTWNVRTLVESTGDVRICRKRQGQNKGNGVDRKLDLLVGELKRYGISVAGIQETKWFGTDVWPAAKGFTFLHSGRPLPANGEDAARNEGVGIMLDPKATIAWKEAGEVWEAVNSRLVTARLKWVGKGQRRHGRSNTFMSIICAYAPTSRAPSGVKAHFCSDLQDTLDKIPQNDILVVLGDFNARVGVLKPDDDLWHGVIGRHGIDERNLAGEEFLQFCTVNQLTVMNTWFQKKEVYFGTWLHPATKKEHMLDLIVMRAAQRACCRDVRVMRGANCWTDHKMVRVKLSLKLPSISTRKDNKSIPFAVHELSTKRRRDEYMDCLEKSLQNRPHCSERSAEENWIAIKSSIVSTAEKVIGRGRRKQPEWFEETADVLEPLIKAKNEAYAVCLTDNSPDKKRLFRQHQRAVKKAVDKAKEQWVCRVAMEGEAAAKDGQARWRCIRRLQRAHTGRRPIRPSAIRKDNGELTQGPSEVLDRWYQHFDTLLNVESEYSEEVLEGTTVLPPFTDLDNAPSEEELENALSKLKNGKAGGKNGILPELVRCGGSHLWDRLLVLMQDIWREGKVVTDWKNAVVVPIPKKGNLQLCDNWRGISLLDVVGKIFARIIQERLQTIAEYILPESQCGFRKGRGCVDMIFVARQLMEKAIEHGETLFVLFVDLKKAYDSVPRQALWKVLMKCGVPTRMLGIIQSFHQDMNAEVRVGSAMSESLEVKNGLRQGCTLAPTLFNMYFSAMVACWRNECVEAGVDVLFKHGRKLVGDRTAKSRLEVVRVTESQFADDVALYSGSHHDFVTIAKKFVNVAKKWGLTVNIQKTKGMVMSEMVSDSDVCPIQVEGGEIEMVDCFTYLGSNLSRDGNVMSEVSSRIEKASRAFGCLRGPIFNNPNMSVATKRAVYKAVVLAVLLYGSETWALKAQHIRRLNVFHNRSVRTILGVTRYQQWQQSLTTEALAESFGMPLTIPDIIMEHRLKWIGHVGRMNERQLPKKLLFGELRKTRPSHGTKRRWRDLVGLDLKSIGVKDNWYQLCQDRKKWFDLCQERVNEIREKNTCIANRPSQEHSYVCECGRTFHRPGDLTRHQRFCHSLPTGDLPSAREDTHRAPLSW